MALYEYVMCTCLVKCFTKLNILNSFKIKGKALRFIVKNADLGSKATYSLDGLLAKGYLSIVGIRFLDGIFSVCTK